MHSGKLRYFPNRLESILIINFIVRIVMAFTNQKSIFNIINIVKFFLNRKYTTTILKKIYSKFFDPKPKLNNKENLDQIEKNKISSEEFIKKINPELLKIANESSMNVTIIRPSLVYGPNSKGNIKLMMTGIKKGWFPPLPETKNKKSFNLIKSNLTIHLNKS